MSASAIVSSGIGCSEEHADVAEGLVAGVEQPDLHHLVGVHVRDHLRAHPLPRGPAEREVVLDHPLLNGSATTGQPSMIPKTRATKAGVRRWSRA